MNVALLVFIQGLRAESTKAVTGRQCPHSREGEDFLTRRPSFFYETAITWEQKVKKSFPMWEMNRLSGLLTKIGVVLQKSYFWAQKRDFWPKKTHFSVPTMFWPRTKKVVQRKKYPFLK